MRRIASFVPPVAGAAGSVAADASVLDMADEVCRAFGAGDVEPFRPRPLHLLLVPGSTPGGGVSARW